MSSYTLLVNSCDAFADCWLPFFSLLQRYWPELRAPILLNTEKLAFAHERIPVKVSRVASGVTRRLTWSETLLGALSQVETELVLYVQEDYFLNAPVDGALVDEFATLMLKENLATVQLTPFGSDGPFHATKYPLLWEVDRRAPYRIALQAALWQRKRLQSYLRPHENAWQFEVLGSIRSRRVSEHFYALNRDLFSTKGRQVFGYVKTGIIKGQWFAPAVVDLFHENGIAMDFSRRGFFEERSRTVERVRTLARIIGHPLSLLRSLR
jgi:hypothetical protein